MVEEFLEKKKQKLFSGILLMFLFLLPITLLLSFLKLEVPFIICLFILGVILLVEGADWVVYTATHFARLFGVPPLIIGLFFVAVFSSVPEFAVVLYAIATEHSTLALATMIGSTIATIGLVLGLSAIIVPLQIRSFTVLLEAPFLLLATVVIFVLSFRLFDFGSSQYILGKIDGVIMILFFIMFLAYTWKYTVVHESKRVEKEYRQEFGKGLIHFVRALFVFAVGVIAVSLGAKFVVSTSIGLANTFGMSETTTGLTLVAVGTALPELVISLVGLFKKEYDLVVGNILGSNIITLLFIGGVAALFGPLKVDVHLLFIDMVFLILYASVFQIFIVSNRTISRKEGIILFGVYVLYFFYTLLY